MPATYAPAAALAPPKGQKKHTQAASSSTYVCSQTIRQTSQSIKILKKSHTRTRAQEKPHPSTQHHNTPYGQQNLPSRRDAGLGG